MVLEEVLGEVLDFWKGVVMVPGYDGVGAIPSFWERAWMLVKFRKDSVGFLLREGRLYRPRLLEGVRKVRVEEWRESGNDFYEFVCLSRRRCVGIRINGLLGGISS